MVIVYAAMIIIIIMTIKNVQIHTSLSALLRDFCSFIILGSFGVRYVRNSLVWKLEMDYFRAIRESS